MGKAIVGNLNKENILYSIIGFLLFIIFVLLIAIYKLKN